MARTTNDSGAASIDGLSRAFRAIERLSPDGHRTVHGRLAAAFWCARAAELQLSRVAADTWTIGRADRWAPLDQAGRVLFRVRSRTAEEAVLAIDGAIAHVGRGAKEQLSVVAAARSDDEANQALASMRRMFPKPAPEDRHVEMKFWSYCHGASSRDEAIGVCRWEEVQSNYAERTLADLVPLMTTPAVTETGKLVLWLGPPGTGKTFALRALAWEQRAHVTVHYILDPEVFLERIEYVTSVFSDDETECGPTDPEASDRARLIVLEDAGELLGADAMARTGHGLSRLLNLTDGLPGQTSRTRVLITTNEDIGRLHPAVTRAGRCASLVRFSPLDEHEASAWLRRRGREDLIDDRKAGASIADLFARLRGDPRAGSGAASLGFGHGR